MAAIFFGTKTKKPKFFLGNKKVKKIYINNIKVYSSGSLVTYHDANGNILYPQTEFEEGQEIWHPEFTDTQIKTPSGKIFYGWTKNPNPILSEGRIEYLVADGNEINLYPLFLDQITNFSYTGAMQQFQAFPGVEYEFEVQGASGGSVNIVGHSGSSVINLKSQTGSSGGISKGTKYFDTKTMLYIMLGAKGGTGNTPRHSDYSSFPSLGAGGGGFNGGASGFAQIPRNPSSSGGNAAMYCTGGGGGASLIALSPGTDATPGHIRGYASGNAKNQLLLVAGGGGGGWATSDRPGPTYALTEPTYSGKTSGGGAQATVLPSITKINFGEAKAGNACGGGYAASNVDGSGSHYGYGGSGYCKTDYFSSSSTSTGSNTGNGTAKITVKKVDLAIPKVRIHINGVITEYNNIKTGTQILNADGKIVFIDLPTPTKGTGWTFLGWSIASNSSTIAKNVIKTSTPIDLYAVFKHDDLTQQPFKISLTDTVWNLQLDTQSFYPAYYVYCGWGYWSYDPDHPYVGKFVDNNNQLIYIDKTLYSSITINFYSSSISSFIKSSMRGASSYFELKCGNDYKQIATQSNGWEEGDNWGRPATTWSGEYSMNFTNTTTKSELGFTISGTTGSGTAVHCNFRYMLYPTYTLKGRTLVG